MKLIFHGNIKLHMTSYDLLDANFIRLFIKCILKPYMYVRHTLRLWGHNSRENRYSFQSGK